MKTQKYNSQPRLDEWNNIDEHGYLYHKAQWSEPKLSTLAFLNFAGEYISKSNNVIDMGAGAGAATATLAVKYKNCNFTAFDYSAELINIGKKLCDERSIHNLKFQHGDWYGIEDSKNKYDGCVTLQTLSWLPDCYDPLKIIFQRLSPNWIALTSLFYHGDITCRIEVEEHIRKRKSYYNIYSLPSIERLCHESGYRLVKFMPFDIDVDIERPSNPDLMGTYTRKVVGDRDAEERIQISGPLLMSWYMLFIEKV
jgi:2-polyprenyl-3-methyl-5-hydroxy-6-metoxy-1,4-benzoquinol methylase